MAPTTDRPVKVQDGYTYKGRFIERATWTYYGRQGRGGKMGNIHKTVWKIEGAPGFFHTLTAAVTWVDGQGKR